MCISPSSAGSCEDKFQDRTAAAEVARAALQRSHTLSVNTGTLYGPSINVGPKLNASTCWLRTVLAEADLLLNFCSEMSSMQMSLTRHFATNAQHGEVDK